MSQHILEWARRHASRHLDGNAITDLKGGFSDETIAAERGLPRAAVAGIRSFYDQLEPCPRVCDGTACHFAGSSALAEQMAAREKVGAVRCLGHCYDAPAVRIGDTVYTRRDSTRLEAWLAGQDSSLSPAADTSPIPRRSLAEPPVVLRQLLYKQQQTVIWDDYDLPDGETILSVIAASGLRGRGGAAFPTAAKWQAARDTPAPARYVVANGDEGDPGSFVDRLLMEEAPHAILAGMLACARVIGARHGIVYIRAEYPHALALMQEAVQAARDKGRLGDHFDVEVISGAGSYVCGEETALLNSIEGLRGEPRVKPPFPAQAGLHGLPTVVQNVETLAIVPWIVRTGCGSGTKAVSLSGAIMQPGVVEVPLGLPLRRVLEEGGGGAPPGRRGYTALVGGPMGRVLPETLFDTPLSYDALPGIGHAGVVVLDETVSARELAHHLFAFARAESCGSCTPCRAGTARLAEMPDRVRLERLMTTLEMGSFCGFGQGVPRPIRDLLEHYEKELFPC